MNTRRPLRLRTSVAAKLRSTRGLTLTELMVTTVVVLLVTACMVTGISLANRQFVISMRTSESRSLYSTLANAVQGELRLAESACFDMTPEDDGAYPLVELFSRNYAIKYQGGTGTERSEFLVVEDDEIITSGDFGHLALGSSTYEEWKELVSSSVYTYNMGAKISVTGYKKTVGSTDLVDHYHVVLSIGDKSDSSEVYTSGEFDVVPLNNVGFDDASAS